MSSHTAGPPTSAPTGRTRGPHRRPKHARQRRRPLPPPARAACRFISDAEVLELVAQAIDVDLEPELDGRRLRRLNSAVNRYRLERRALADARNAERYTSRRQLAEALYGPGVDLNSVKRQIKRVEADLAAAGLLDVAVLVDAGGQDRGLRIRVLDPLVPSRVAVATRDGSLEPGDAARLYLRQRAETRRERLERRHAPYRRQQSDRKPRGGVPGLYVRTRDADAATSSPRNCHPREPRPGYGTTSLPRPSAHKCERDARLAPPRPDGAAAPGADRPTRKSRRAGEREQGAHRWAALDRLRQIALRERGPERLLEEARRGAPVCAIAVAAFEAAFVVDAPGSWHTLGDPDEDLRIRPDLLERHDALELEPVFTYRTLTARWARRLEAACRQIDRLEGPHAGIATLLDLVVGWTPDAGAATGAGRDLGFPAALAYFVRRLQVEARALRRRRDPSRRLRSALWRDEARRGRDGNVN